MSTVDDRLAAAARGTLASLVSPSPEGSPFWQALAAHRVTLPYCSSCRAPFFYPRPLCPRCGSRDVSTLESSGRGTVYSFCVHFHSALAPLANAVPFVTALVDLAEGPRVPGFLTGVPDDPDLIRCGIPVRAGFLDTADGITFLTFHPDVS